MSPPEPNSERALAATLAGRLWLRAHQTPRGIALRQKRYGIWEEVTWSAYCRMAGATARMLAELGVRPGSAVAIVSDNRREWLYADLGTQALGARSVGVYQTSPPEDLLYVVDHSGAEILFCEDQEQVDKFLEVEDRLPRVRHVVVFEPRGTRHYDDTRLMAWDDFIDQGQQLLERQPNWLRTRLLELDPTEPAMVIYTSGTTGLPKGALLGNANVVPVVESAIERIGVREGDSVLSYLPLCHVAEKIFSVFLPLLAGLTVHFGESIDTVQEDLREVSPTIFLGVPRIWEKMHSGLSVRMHNSSWLKRTLFDYWTARGREIAARGGPRGLADQLLWRTGDLLVFRPLQERLGLRRCRVPISGAAPISPELIDWFRGIGVPLREGYGMTETSGVATLNVATATKPGTVGQIIPKMECRIADDGEILIRGPGVFMGYLHDDETTRDTIDREGWLHSGDVGEIDDEGYLKITGRKKEIIITAGGKNLSPEKIENVLKLSPYIKEAIAIGDRRKFVSALVQIDYETTGEWAQRRGIAYTSYPDLASKPDVLGLVDSEIAKANKLLARVEQVRQFRLLPKQLHQDDGELTATQKVRRRSVLSAYQPLIEQMYA